MDDPVHHGIVGEESDDLHRGAALDTGQGIHLKDFSDHLCPAAAGDPRALLLNDDGWMLVHLCLAHLAPVSIGVQAEVTEGDLPLIGNMGSHPGDELQVVHALHHLLDDRSEEPVVLLEAVFILRKEPGKVMEEHAVENGALRMSRPVDSCHGRNNDTINRPGVSRNLNNKG